MNGSVEDGELNEDMGDLGFGIVKEKERLHLEEESQELPIRRKGGLLDEELEP